MAEQKNEVAATFSELLTDRLDSVATALPKSFNTARFVQNAMAVLNGNEQLQKCNKTQILQGLMKGAYLGLDFANREAYLVPYGGTVQFQTSYMGDVKFTKQYSIRPIQDIAAEVIREGDTFERRIEDGNDYFNYTQKSIGTPIIGAFAYCKFKDGGCQVEVMSLDEINAVRNSYSKAKSSKPWTDSFGEMAKKTVLRRLCKHINTDFENVEQRNAWEEGSGMDFTQTRSNGNPDEVVDAFAKKETEPEVVADVVVEEVTAGDPYDVFK